MEMSYRKPVALRRFWRLAAMLSVAVLLLSACQPAPAPQPTSTPVPASATPTATETAVPPTRTPRPTYTPRPTSTPRPELAETWRLEPMTDAVFLVDDYNTDAEMDEIITLQARNLSIPDGYSWEIYGLPDDVHYSDVRQHYLDQCPEGFTLANDIQGTNNIFLMVLLKGDQRITIQFWGKKPNNHPAVLLLYSGF